MVKVLHSFVALAVVFCLLLQYYYTTVTTDDFVFRCPELAEHRFRVNSTLYDLFNAISIV